MGKNVTLSVIKADVGGNVGKTVWYRGAWETHTLEIGPEPAKATVTG